MNRDDFLLSLDKNFPGWKEGLTEYEQGLLHCEVAAFRRYAERHLAERKEWECEKIFRLVAETLRTAEPDLENALNISFVEDLAHGELSKEDRKIIINRAPKVLADEIRAHRSHITERWSNK